MLNWISFAFFVLGSLGGIAYLLEYFMDMAHVRSMAKGGVVNYHPDDPVENITQLYQPIEPPISARRK